ncbi:MAG: monoamine oxidase [Gammaproteobacteria bacterium]|jgi:monoamine oxidase
MSPLYANPSSPPTSAFGPDFPFDYKHWIGDTGGLGEIPESFYGREVAVVGAGIAGVVAAYELMKMGFKPVIFEADRIGGRLRSHKFDGVDDVFAELGGMRFPRSSTAFYHYVDELGLSTRPFPNPLSAGANSTVIDIGGITSYAETIDDLPPIYREISSAWRAALEDGAQLSAMHQAVREKDVDRIKAIWNPLIQRWDERTFYDFLAQAKAFSSLSFRHREIFGQVGFGTGGWDSDFSNTMLEIFRVVMTGCEDDQYYILEGAEQVVRRLWAHAPSHLMHWSPGTSLQRLHRDVPETAVAKICRSDDGRRLEITDRRGLSRQYDAAIITCQTWLLTTNIEVDESLFSQELWMALDRTRYMQSSKTFVMVDHPFWKMKSSATSRDLMSMTLTDRLTRGTYLFDYGDDRPGVICLSYAWMSDALKMLPLSTERRVEIALTVLEKIYPKLDIKQHIIGDPVTVSWEADPNFSGAFKGALPGHYRYNRRMFTHFMQDKLPASQRGIFLAGDDISWTPGWAEGAVQTALNAVWGIMHYFGGASPAKNPGPGDRYSDIEPLSLAD